MAIDDVEHLLWTPPDATDLERDLRLLVLRWRVPPRSGRLVADDPVPPGILLDLEEALRILSAFEDALTALHLAGSSIGLRDEIATMIHSLHRQLGLDPGGAHE